MRDRDDRQTVGVQLVEQLETPMLVGRGLSDQEIAELLFISPHTAKTHVNRIMAKAGAHDRAQLVILAYESGPLSVARQTLPEIVP